MDGLEGLGAHQSEGVGDRRGGVVYKLNLVEFQAVRSLGEKGPALGVVVIPALAGAVAVGLAGQPVRVW